MTDYEMLLFFYNRLVHIHNEDERTDYMRWLRIYVYQMEGKDVRSVQYKFLPDLPRKDDT